MLFIDDIKLEFLFLVLTHENDQNPNIANYLFALSKAQKSNSRIDNEKLTMVKLPFTFGKLWFDAHNEWSDIASLIFYVLRDQQIFLPRQVQNSRLLPLCCIDSDWGYGLGENLKLE